LYGLGLIVLFYVYQKKKKSGCVITNQRVVQTRGGLFSTETREIRIDDIRSISTYSGLTAGGVKLETGVGEIKVNAVNPREIADVIREEKNRRQNS